MQVCADKLIQSCIYIRHGETIVVFIIKQVAGENHAQAAIER